MADPQLTNIFSYTGFLDENYDLSGIDFFEWHKVVLSFILPTLYVEKTFLSLLNYLGISVKNQITLSLWGYLFYPICLFLCQNHTVLIMITMASWKVLKSNNLSPLTLLFFLKFTLDTLGPVHFHVNFRVSLYFHLKKTFFFFF